MADHNLQAAQLFSLAGPYIRLSGQLAVASLST
jgi:hypothetical protein